MAAVFRKVEEFNSDKDDWPTYVEWLNHFSKITMNEQKQSIFISVIGLATCKLLRSLLSPEKPGDKLYKDFVKRLSEHFNPTPLEIVQKFKFHGQRHVMESTDDTVQQQLIQGAKLTYKRAILLQLAQGLETAAQYMSRHWKPMGLNKWNRNGVKCECPQGCG